MPRDYPLDYPLREKTQHIPFLPTRHFRTVEDKIHWTPETAEAMIKHWLKFLKIERTQHQKK